MMLTQLAEVARRTGYPVVEVKGWKTRGRPGGMAGVKTITCHHTANGGAKGNYPSLRVVRDGRTGLPGPLAHYGIGLDGTIYVIAAGKCNHAGVSRSSAYTNSWAVGIEAEAIGVPGAKGDWPAAQMDSYVRLCRALVDEFRLDSTDVRAHKETCHPVGRKSDPSFDMRPFRAEVRTISPLRKGAQAVDTIDIDNSKQVLPHDLTDADVAAFGDPKLAGKSSGWSSLIRFPPAVARLRRELTQFVASIRSDVKAVRQQAEANGGQLSNLRTEVAELRALVQSLVDSAGSEK